MSESYSDAALRHSGDADQLAVASQLDGAGYLVGYAVECAIKVAVLSTRPNATAPQVHLPRLVEGAKKVLQGRHPSAMATVLKAAAFMQGWRVELRYAGTGTVSLAQFQQWRQDANRALAAAKLRRAT